MSPQEKLIEKINCWKKTFGDLLGPRGKDISENTKWIDIIDRFQTGNMIPLAIGTAMHKWGGFKEEEMKILNALPYYALVKQFVLELETINAFMTVETDEGDEIYFLCEKKGEMYVFEAYIQTENPVGFDSDILVCMPGRYIVLCVEYVTEKPKRAVEFFQELNEFSQIPEDEF